MKKETVKISMGDALLADVFRVCDAIITSATNRHEYDRGLAAARVGAEVKKAAKSRDSRENVEISRKAYDWILENYYHFVKEV
jgi:hypothetical protein